jgi:hypothetical protein
MANKKHRDYENDYPSVTTVLGILRKIGLENWFKYNTPQFIKEESDKGKLIGTQIHEGINNLITTGEIKVETNYASDVMNALKGFMAFKKDHPEYTLISSELPLTSEVYKFNGTLDCIAKKGDTLVLSDWKTGKAKDKDKPDIYDEYKYQVSAYVYLYNEVNKANIEKAFILALAKDKVAYNFCEIGKEEIEDCFNEVFLPALKILKYQKEKKTYVI